MLTDKHIFSIYTDNLFDEHYKIGVEKKIFNEEVVHRLIKILRIEVGEQVIFFDRVSNSTIQVQEISKKYFLAKVLTFQKNVNQATKIKFLLPLLKKEALEEAVYSLAEIGVSEIQLVITEKSRQKLLHEKEFVRLEAILIAAAEQSKNYIFPKIYKPVDLSTLKLKSDQTAIVFDPQGKSFFELQKTDGSLDNIWLLTGPEGGLTGNELQFLENISFKKCRLTPTILRAVQAIALGAGLFKLYK